MKFQAGDVVCFSGTGALATLIKLFTISKITHVGIMIDEENLLEAVQPKLRIANLKKRLKDSDKNIYYCVLNDKNRQIFNSNIDEFNQCVESLVGNPYDTKALFKMAFATLTNHIFKWKDSPDTEICSETDAICLESVDILKNINPSTFTPKMIFELPIYKEKIKIK